METIVRHRDQGTNTWFLNSLVSTKADLDDTGGAYALMEHLLTPAANPPMHVHHDEEEAIYVLDGELEIEVGGDVVHALPGTFALTPAGRPHCLRVLTPTARVLVLSSAPAGATNGGAEAFFRAAGSPALAPILPEPEVPDPVRLTALAADHAIEILPPAGAVKLLVAVAHPDDEAFGCGSVLAHAHAAGVETVVACATRGELGEPAPGLCHVPPGPDALGAIREAELRTATGLLGVRRTEVLGWRDSGVDGAPAAGSLCAAPAADVQEAIAALLEEERPDVVVTLDASDGHRDHAVVRDATIAAADAASRPPAVYLWCLPRSLMRTFTGVDHLGTPDEEITHTLDTSHLLDLRWEAMRAHRSQVPPYDAMDADLQRAFLCTDRLREVRPGAGTWI